MKSNRYQKITNTLLVLRTFVCSSLFIMSFAAESVPAQKTKNRSVNEPLIIQSQVKGSQEQPNVIYIMPWQGVEQVIEVKGKKRTIQLPNFKPIHPRAFKEQVNNFAKKQRIVKQESLTP